MKRTCEFSGDEFDGTAILLPTTEGHMVISPEVFRRVMSGGKDTAPTGAPDDDSKADDDKSTTAAGRKSTTARTGKS